MSAVLKYYMVKTKSDTMPKLKKVTTYVYLYLPVLGSTITTTVHTAISACGSAKCLYFTILGSIDPSPLNDAPA